MAVTLFRDTTYNLTHLIDDLRRGEIALPDIQRPFVWKAAKVRDLFDSMYKGFPVGTLLFWSTGAEVGARRIGVDDKESTPRYMIVDGQQRLTSLYAVLTGKPVLTSDYKETLIRIAFRPRDAAFEVFDAAIERDPEFLPDISVLWGNEGRRSTVRHFLGRLQQAKGAISQDWKDELEESIDRLYDLQNYPFKVIELGADVEEEQVADIFVRINSEGVRLSQADFILTLMSVWWDKGRKQLEDFSRAAKVPTGGVPGPSNPFIDPSPDQLLRVSAGLAFRRGRLRYIYQVLRGKDLETGEVSQERREEQFEALRSAQDAVLDLTNWHEYLKSIQRAGFRSGSMITSENNVLFGYLMYLIGREDFGVDRRQLRDVIARWFFMSAITGRYTGNFESQVEADIRRISEASNAEDFVHALDAIIDTVLTADYWKIQLPAALDTAATYSPTLFAYHASLVLLGATPLFSRLTVNELLDPSTHGPRASVERHHLFPRAYLTKIGVDKTAQRNNIANYAFVEWPDNAAIGDRAPSDYFPSLFDELTPQEQKDARFWHALPEGWETMEYPKFLEARRVLIAKVIRSAFEKLRSGQLPVMDESSTPVTTAQRWTLESLLSEHETETVEFKSSAFYSYNPDIPSRVVTDSIIKSVAGFANAGGGTLAIGIADDGEVLGIHPDLEQKGVSADGYVNALTSIFSTALGGAAAALAKIRIEEFGELPVCLVTVDPSPQPVFAKVAKADHIFFVRINNSTRHLEGADQFAYMRQRWGLAGS